MAFDTLEQCIAENIDNEADPKGYCLMTFPELGRTDSLSKKTANLKLKVQIAYLKKNRNKIAASGDASTSQAEGSPDGPHFTLKKIKREGFPEGRGTKERVGIMKLASQDQDFAKYYLLDSLDTNGNDWGVTEPSIEKNIQSFVDMPFVITDREWIEDSEYEDFDHPSVETNDLRQIFAHQERFRVATIVKIAKDDDDGRWYAMIKRNPKYAHLQLPPFCSPALYMTDPSEADDHITKWFGLHLAGLTRDPAYGPRVALFKGTCTGSMGSCSTQLRMASIKKAADTVIKPVEMIDQSGLDITETDKKASPFEEEQEIKIANLSSRLAKIKQTQDINIRMSRLNTVMAEFKESEHPRDGGKFTSKGGGSTKAPKETKEEKEISDFHAGEKRKVIQLQEVHSILNQVMDKSSNDRPDDDFPSERGVFSKLVDRIEDNIQITGEMANLSDNDIDKFKEVKGDSIDGNDNSKVEHLIKAVDLLDEIMDNSDKSKPDDSELSEFETNEQLKKDIIGNISIYEDDLDIPTNEQFSRGTNKELFKTMHPDSHDLD